MWVPVKLLPLFCLFTLFVVSACSSERDELELQKCDELSEKYSDLIMNDHYPKSERYKFISRLKDELKQFSRLEKTTSSELYMCLYDLYIMADDDDKALISLKKYIAMTEPDAMNYYLSSILNLELGNKTESLMDINQAISINGSLPHLFYQRAIINHQLGNYKDALNDIDKEIQIRGGQIMDTEIYSLRGKIFVSLGEFHNAIQSFKDNLNLINRLFPCREGDSCYLVERVENYNMLMKSYCLTGDKGSALATYQRAKQYKPEPNKPECLE